MCNISGIVFGVKSMRAVDVKGCRVLEVGSKDVNGGLKLVVQSWEPGEYVGVDIENGPGVDRICAVEDLVEEFGAGSFDIVIATELLEHVRNWRTAITNMKEVCKPGGTMLITTRSYGFPYHGYPADFWRFELNDVRTIFSDCAILALERDPESPGVFVKVKKPEQFIAGSLEVHELYSIVVGRRVREVTARDLRSFHFRRLVSRERLRWYLHSAVDRLFSRL